MAEKTSPDPAVPVRRGRRTLWLILAICAAPVIASYFTYYVVRPVGHDNYGTLIEPQRPVPETLALAHLDGRPFPTEALKGHWTLVSVDGGACGEPCAKKLYFMRQLRLTTGKEQDRVERLWLIPDREPLPTFVMRAYDGTLMLHADPEQLAHWLPAEGSSMTDHLYVIDPLGNLMMVFPKDPDPTRAMHDLKRLLAASSVG